MQRKFLSLKMNAPAGLLVPTGAKACRNARCRAGGKAATAKAATALYKAFLGGRLAPSTLRLWPFYPGRVRP
jgi:hypothetical protein